MCFFIFMLYVVIYIIIFYGSLSPLRGVKISFGNVLRFYTSRTLTRHGFNHFILERQPHCLNENESYSILMNIIFVILLVQK